ncbi:YciI family protein [Nocardiopsis sp. NRRL B-16309]|uniref:YciI family protein n=1 Tax=Nocardiopsis sp. NRRL B-16309 TaxID=1519494 RepID=UPI0006ADBEDB|nr:YciI family protein [Nocardiopsis sp. NRRL B-16309]KOX16930.1 hypothetical protein ADL05_09925 [Nocardiopsis sp. NRRL B-16309]
MFVVLLEFTEKRSRAAEFMDGHGDWIRRGFDDGVFLLVGGLRPERGGAVVTHGESREELEARVKDDPFVAEGVVTATILDIAPARADERLGFLLG